MAQALSPCPLSPSLSLEALSLEERRNPEKGLRRFLVYARRIA